ncbi:MAG: IS1634 family transposase [Bacteroidales bacterium]
MATIQAKKSKGYKYWYIVESRRVNGKPRPVVLAYLGKAEDLLNRLNQSTEALTLKSYAHGAMAALLKKTIDLDMVKTINKYIQSRKPYRSEKPVRHNLTAGITFLLGAIGRICMPTSKQGWWNWAKGTSAEYLLRCSLCKMDSRHFWDLMDALPEENIASLEEELIKKVLQQYDISSQTLLYDTTNFFTYIHTTNTKNTIAQRGKNKQKRGDLRQVGMALVVTQKDSIPLFHYTYQGNRHDSVVFKNLIKQLHQRLNNLELSPDRHTIVFDRGNNSKTNLQQLREAGMYYIGALNPSDFKQLIYDTEDKYQAVNVKGGTLQVARQQAFVWGKMETVLIFVSDRLKAGQIRGIYQALEKKEKQLQQLQEKLAGSNARRRNRANLEEQIARICKGQFINGIINCSLKVRKGSDQSEGQNNGDDLPDKGHFLLQYTIQHERLKEIEEQLGFRVLMTNRDEWSTATIIQSFYDQSVVEGAFKEMKNPHHLAVRPQYHWTDQKIRVHFFICVLGYLLASLVKKELKEKTGYSGSMDTLINSLNNIRLATILENSNKPGKPKARYKLEEMNDHEKQIMEALEISEFHLKKQKINGVGVYN